MNKTKYIHEPSKERLWYMEVIVIAYSLSVKENIVSAIFFFLFRRTHFMLKQLMLLLSKMLVFVTCVV